MVDARHVAIPLREGGLAGDQAVRERDSPRQGRLSGGIESGRRDSGEDRDVTDGSWLEVRGVLESKIPVNDGDEHLVAEGRPLACEAGFDLAVRGAAVAVDVVPVVARLADHDAVAAPGHASAGRAVGLALTVRRAAVERHRVAVVAALRAFDDFVAAGRVRANAGVAAALVAELRLARARTAVARGQVAVVAQLRQDDDAVATARNPMARRTRRNA